MSTGNHSAQGIEVFKIKLIQGNGVIKTIDPIPVNAEEICVTVGAEGDLKIEDSKVPISYILKPSNDNDVEWVCVNFATRDTINFKIPGSVNITTPSGDKSVRIDVEISQSTLGRTVGKNAEIQHQKILKPGDFLVSKAIGDCIERIPKECADYGSFWEQVAISIKSIFNAQNVVIIHAKDKKNQTFAKKKISLPKILGTSGKIPLLSKDDFDVFFNHYMLKGKSPLMIRDVMANSIAEIGKEKMSDWGTAMVAPCTRSGVFALVFSGKIGEHWDSVDLQALDRFLVYIRIVATNKPMLMRMHPDDMLDQIVWLNLIDILNEIIVDYAIKNLGDFKDQVEKVKIQSKIQRRTGLILGSTGRTIKDTPDILPERLDSSYVLAKRSFFNRNNIIFRYLKWDLLQSCEDNQVFPDTIRPAWVNTLK